MCTAASRTPGVCYLSAVERLCACSQALFTIFRFHFPLLVAFLQMLVIAPVCYAVARPRLSWDITRSVLPLALVNVLNVVCGLIGTALPSHLSGEHGCACLTVLHAQ